MYLTLVSNLCLAVIIPLYQHLVGIWWWLFTVPELAFFSYAYCFSIRTVKIKHGNTTGFTFDNAILCNHACALCEEFAEDMKKCQCQLMSTGTLSIFLCPVAQPTTLGRFVTTSTANGRKMEKLKTQLNADVFFRKILRLCCSSERK